MSDARSAVADADNSPMARFIAAHLPTSAERAVFSVLTRSRHRWWTAGSVSEAAMLGDHEADLTLRRFSAAGILESLDEPGCPRRYRWRSEMAYLHDGTEPSGTTDPMCGMPIPADTPHTAEQDGRRVAFCSLPCLVRWRAMQGSPGSRL